MTFLFHHFVTGRTLPEKLTRLKPPWLKIVRFTVDPLTQAISKVTVNQNIKSFLAFIVSLKYLSIYNLASKVTGVLF